MMPGRGMPDLENRSLRGMRWNTIQILVASSVLTLLISTTAFSQERKLMLDADIEALLLSRVALGRWVDLVQERGVSFAPSQAVRTRLLIQK